MTKKQAMQLFEERKIRTVWDDKEEKWYFSVVDVVGALTDSADPNTYWRVMKKRLRDEGNETVTNCNALKMLAADGKMRKTDVADQEQLFRIIQSVPSPKAEPFKLWMAHVASQRVDQIQDPELSIEQAVADYRRLGYDEAWIRQRLQNIRVRKTLTDEWKRGGIEDSHDYATLTDIITQSWSGISTRQYKQYKGIDKTKLNLRDNMTDVELALTTLAEASTVALSKETNPKGMREHRVVAREGGSVARDARQSLEKRLGHSVISPTNAHEMLLGHEDTPQQLIDLCCVGHITRDRIITPKSDVYMDGGVSFYFANALRNLPPTVNFCLVTKLAQEHRAAAQKMIDNGIDVRVGDSKDTVFFVNIYGDNPDDRSQKVLAKSDAFTLSDMEGVNARYYHLGSLMADDFPKDFIAELSKRGKVSLDAQGFLREVRGEEVFACDWQDKLDILRHTSILKVNETEAETITGIADPLEAAKVIAAWGVEEVVMTLGSRGSLIYADGTAHHIPAIAPHEVVDATGCGDTFMAAYLYQRAAGKEISEAGLFAAAVCSIKLEHTGPFEGSIEEVRQRIENR